ncbi:MAG: GNAT family N-acetyltransferase [Acidobacteria bacterium]|nr:MAG: GNAT family N-acetyltransferase [Acidobacteriota bacterium]
MMRSFYADLGEPFEEVRAERALRALLADPSYGAAWVFREDGRAIGYLVVTHGYSLEFGGRDAFVDEVYVVPEMRGRGLGARALVLAEEHCRHQRIAALRLEVHHENRRALALYERNGFEAHDRYLMTKWL